MCIMHLVLRKIGTKKPSAYITLSDPVRTLGMVGVTGLEPAAPRPPDVCATNGATPRNISAPKVALWSG